MTGLKWFAGGKERREQAVAIIDEVIETIGDKPDYAGLKQVLHSYRTELADSRSATPYIVLTPKSQTFNLSKGFSSVLHRTESFSTICQAYQGI